MRSRPAFTHREGMETSSNFFIRRWLLVLVLAILCVILTGVGSATLPNRFVVSEVVVTDARPELVEPIRSAAREIIDRDGRLFGKTNIFVVPRMQLEGELPETFPAINTVQVLRRLPGTVRIRVQEHIPTAILYVHDTYFALDPEGVAFDVVPPERLRELTYPIIRDQRPDARVELGMAVLSPDVLTRVHDLIPLLPERFHLTPKEITIPAIGAEELRIRTHEEWTLILDMRRELSQQLAVLEKLFAEEIDENERARLDVLDLRIPGKAFYTLKRSPRRP